MPLTRKQKEEIINNLEEKVSRQKSIVFVSIKGLKAEELFELRKKLREKDCLLFVVKKTLLGRVLKENKINCDVEEMEGQLAVIFSFKDELSAAKTSYNFSLIPGANKGKLKILGGFLEGSFMDSEKTIDLAKIPSKEELLGRFIGSIKAPIANLTIVLQGNIKNLVYILSKIKA